VRTPLAGLQTHLEVTAQEQDPSVETALPRY
jgi:hypothetical protein